MNPHLKPRTVREWMELIPFDRARKEALENFDGTNSKTETLSGAIILAFSWLDTEQGHWYWKNLHQSIQNMEQSIKLK